MVLFKEAATLSRYIHLQKQNGKKPGFVPTMGALHQGHLSLIKAARETNDLTVCSIFINPTQFNNPEDFKYYPVTIEKDIEALENSGCDVLFLPSVTEIYPPGYKAKHYDLGQIETVLEGAFRPGHFQGVCQVVDRLLEIVQPDELLLGQKDFQQCMVISKLLSLLHKDDQIKLSIIPTLREKSGLAMSSRNTRLDESQKQQATLLFKELSIIQTNLEKKELEVLKNEARVRLEENGFVVDYVEIAHTEDLRAAVTSQGKLVALVAASLGNVRLIDNLLLN